MASAAFLSKANTTFALDLLKKFSEEDKVGNIFYSPFSISAALAMVKRGAGGNTATQISAVLRFSEHPVPQPEGDRSQISMQTDRPYPMLSQMQTRREIKTQTQYSSRLPDYLKKCLKKQGDEKQGDEEQGDVKQGDEEQADVEQGGEEQGDVDAGFAQLLGDLNKPDALYALNIANRLYGEQTYTFDEDFVSETEKHFKAPFEKADFSNNPEQSRNDINEWVEEQTQGKIPDLLSSDAVDSSTKLVLVNAIYFKGKWEAQFDEKSTTDAEFRLNKTDVKPVKMMRQKGNFNFSFNEEANCKVLELPYKGDELSMILILPDDIEDDTTGLEKLEKELTYEKFKKWTEKDAMGQSEVEVMLPRFKMEESYDLKEVLISLGMKDAFDVSKSDFSGMSKANDLVLSKAVHKAFVEVNEEGTEATAASAAVFVERAAIIVEKFFADHPFLFFIKHNSSNSVLFAGRFCSPE